MCVGCRVSEQRPVLNPMEAAYFVIKSSSDVGGDSKGWHVRTAGAIYAIL